MTEEERLRSLRELFVLDSEPEPLFDSFARLASEACGASIGLLTLVDEQRLWLKANVGLAGVHETARDVAVCSHTIQAGGVFEVPDLTRDARFAANPLVAGAPDLRFYAGAPLSIDGGARVGALCVIDRAPGQLSREQSATLEMLASLASQALTLRRDLITRALAVRSEYEARLAQSEAMHRALIEAQSELVSLAEPDGTLVYVSPTYARYFGSTPEAMLGRNLLDWVAAPDRQAVTEKLAESVARGEPVHSENRMRHADGSERWVSWNNSIHLEPSGRRRIHCVGRDVTERRRAEEELRASRSLLESAGRLAGVGGWQLELATGRMQWSAQTRRICGVADDFLPTVKATLAFFSEEDRALIEAASRAAITDGTPWDIELTVVTPAGRRVWIRGLGEVEREGGVAVRLIGSIADITERKLLAQRLEESDRFIRQVTDHLPIRIAYTDRERRFRFLNQAGCQRYGLGRSEILGRTPLELVGPTVSDWVEVRARQALAGEPQRFEAEELIDGVVRLVEFQFVPDIGPDGSVRGLYSVVADITDRAAADRQIRELNAILENTLDYVVKADLNGTVVYLNPAARRFFGLTTAEPIDGRSFLDFIASPSENAFWSEILPAVQGTGAWSGEARLRGADGVETPISHLVIGHHGADGQLNGFSAVMRDISRSVADRRNLQAQTSALRAVMEAIPAIVAVVDPDGLVRMVNSACERWTGIDREQAIGRCLAETLGPEDQPGTRPWSQRALAGETGSYDKVDTSPSGLPRHVAGSYTPLLNEAGAAEGFILVAQDVTEHKLEEVRLLQLSRRDPLTGLLNRAGFDAEVERLLQGGLGSRLALLCIDLDHFKPVNDRHGHPVGDAVLRGFAQRMARLVRPTDLVARLGGDEFAILLSGIGSSDQARKIADKVIAEACQPFDVAGLHLQIGASVGVAHNADAAGGWQSLLARADTMLYRAKEAGRSRQASESMFMSEG